MADNNFASTMESLFKGMDGFVTTKTVVGDVMNVGDTIIVPLAEATFGVGAGVATGDKNKGGGGMGGKVVPSAVLVIKDGTTKLVNIKNQDTVTKLIDMVPDLIEKFTKKNDEEDNNEDSETEE
ncbi:MAG: sporulation protein [Lachnospiraceae bacterium]|nr:sporulation protein [Lachnospiraceae bacterium]